MDQAMTRKIEAALAAGQWLRARRLIRAELNGNPDEHWLVARLSETYYEQKNYRKALEHAKQAIRLAPDCPMAMWDLAGAQFATGDLSQAVRTYKKLLTAAQKVIAEEEYDDPCWEGRQETLALANDCLFRLGVCLQEATKKKNLSGELKVKCRRGALRAFQAYLGSQADFPGIYQPEDALKRIRNLKEQDPHLATVDFESVQKAAESATKALSLAR